MRNILFTLAILIPTLSISQNDSTIIPTEKDSVGFDQTAVTVISGADLTDNGQGQDISGLLQASRDVFIGVAGFNFSAARFRMRGYDNQHFSVYMNGVPMNDPELGFAIWANWGGLNDITRYPESRPGISENSYGFGGINGFSNVDMRASSQRKGTRFSQAATNRSYRNRSMFTHSTGMRDDGWAFSMSLAYRWADEGYVEGTNYSGLSYFGSIEKKLNEGHSIGLIGFGAPTVRGRSGIAQQEIYDLTGNNFYNPYWGYQNGEKRNSRIRDSHKPTFILWDDYKINDKLFLNTNLYAQVGHYGQTRLNWYNAPDPRPEYYRYLPSYFETEDPSMVGEITSLWQNDQSYSQIDWDQLYFANGKNLASVEDANGIEGNTVTGNRAKYILEEERSDPRLYGANILLNAKPSDKLNIDGGVSIALNTSRNYKIAKDLLGADFWVDTDQFAERDFGDAAIAQNDINTPNKIINEGDEYAYDYEIHTDKKEVFVQAEYDVNAKLELFGALNVGQTQLWRDGAYANGRFPDDSEGESEKKNFGTYGVKGGAMYKFTGRHLLSLNFLSQSRAPIARNAFQSPRTRNQFVKGLEVEDIISAELNYHVRYAEFKARLTGFYTEINNQVWNRSFYHDEFLSFVNYSMTNVDHVYTGVEFGFDWSVSPTVTLKGAFAHGQYLYNSRPLATITVDNSNEILAEDRVVYLKNYKIGGRPQTAANVGFTYRAPKYWFAGADLNIFDNLNLDPNPDRRTSEAVGKYIPDDPQWTEVLGQESLNAGNSVNMFIGKSWRFDYKYYLLLTLNVNNVLDNTDFRTGGYEQLRYDSNDIGRFPARYGYMYGRSFFAMIRFSF